MKFLNCFFSSFFRTLGRIIVYILLGVLFSVVLSKIDVHADTDSYVKLNEVTLNYKDYVYIPQGNIVFEFDEGNLYSSNQVPQNFLATFCSSDDKITNWYSNINDGFPHELNIYKTNIPCQYSTSDYQGGRLTYFYGKSFTCSVSGDDTCHSWGKWTFYSYSGSYQLLNFITTNDDISIDFSSGAVISQNQEIINQNQQIINGQNNIINNQNNNTDKVIDNQNSNTDKTIENQNENTDKQIDSQKVCKEIGKNDGFIFNKYLDSNGNLQTPTGTYSVTDYYFINGGSVEVLKARPDKGTSSCFYGNDKSLISCFNNSSNGFIDVPNNAYYVRFTINSSVDVPTFKICQNGNQAISGGLNDINSSINDTSSPNLDSLKNSAGWLPAGPIDSILNLPLTLLNSLTTNLSKSCSPVELPLPFIDKNLTLPCLSSIYSQIDGLSVWINSISVIASAFILFQYLMNLYKWVDDTLSFRENNFIDNWTGV